MAFVIFKFFFPSLNFLFWFQTKSVGNSYLQVCYFFLCVCFVSCFVVFVVLIYQRKLLKLAHWKCPFVGPSHLAFTRGRASIVLVCSIGVVKHQQGQKQHSKYRSPMHLGLQSQQWEVVEHPSIFSGASIHTRPSPLRV